MTIRHLEKQIDELDKSVTVIEVLEKLRAEIEQKIEQERFARSVFRGEEKDAVNAEQCTGSIFAYNNVIKFIDKYEELTEAVAAWMPLQKLYKPQESEEV